MEKEYLIKLHDDSILEFKLISKDIFDEMIKQKGWIEYPEILKIQSSLRFTIAYTNGTEFIALKKKNLKENAIFCKHELFFQLLKEGILVFYGERNFDPDSAHFMLIIPKEKVDVLFMNHTKKQIQGFSSVEQYYELDDGRYVILFNDGGAEVFMNFKDMEILEDIIG